MTRMYIRWIRLKRRFDWGVCFHRACDRQATETRDSHLNNPKVKIAVDKNRAHDLETTWQSFYMALNAFITDKREAWEREDKQVGQFFLTLQSRLFWILIPRSCLRRTLQNEKINKMIKNKLLLYLWQDVTGIAVMGRNESV